MVLVWKAIYVMDLVFVIACISLLMAYEIMFLTGDSMSPTIRHGSVVLCEHPPVDVAVNDIIVFRAGQILVQHRVINRTADGGCFLTKGDNNSYNDTWLYELEKRPCLTPDRIQLPNRSCHSISCLSASTPSRRC